MIELGDEQDQAASHATAEFLKAHDQAPAPCKVCGQPLPRKEGFSVWVEFDKHKQVTETYGVHSYHNYRAATTKSTTPGE